MCIILEMVYSKHDFSYSFEIVKLCFESINSDDVMHTLYTGVKFTALLIGISKSCCLSPLGYVSTQGQTPLEYLSNIHAIQTNGQWHLAFIVSFFPLIKQFLGMTKM